MRASAIGPAVGAEVQAEEPLHLVQRGVDESKRYLLVGRECEAAEDRLQGPEFRPTEKQPGDAIAAIRPCMRVPEVALERASEDLEQLGVRITEVAARSSAVLNVRRAALGNEQGRQLHFSHSQAAATVRRCTGGNGDKVAG